MDSVTGIDGSNGARVPTAGADAEVQFNIGPDGLNAAAATSATIASNLSEISNGDRGDDVRLLQQTLSALGYNPGTADGIFGSRTEAAVRDFQRDQGIRADGIVGRGETWPGLLDAMSSRRERLIQATADAGPGFPVDDILQEISRLDGLISGVSGTGGTYTVQPGDTLSGIAQRHGVSLNDLLSANPQITNPNMIQIGQEINLPAGAETGGSGGPSNPVGGADIQALVAAVPASIRNAHPQVAVDIERIVDVARREGLTQEQTAYVLATATHENHLGRFPVELDSGQRYENRPDLGNTQPGDGPRFRGRGYVQLTGRRNYEDWSNRLGIDLVNNPELASDPEIAAQILVIGMRDGTFTGRRLDRYINASGTDFINARRVVNGTDRASLIAGYASDFNSALAQSSSAAPIGAQPGAGASVSVGPEGSNSDIWLKATANIDNLDQRVVDTFDDIVAAWAAAGGPTPVITSGNDGRHSQGSLHFSNLAIDLRTNNISDSLSQSIADDLARRLGPDFDVLFERFPSNPANDHIHIEYDPD